MSADRIAPLRWSRSRADHSIATLDEIAERGFCSVCGTPLTFAFPDSDRMDLTVGSFDDPSRFVPHHHFSIETRLAPWVDTSHLPGYRLDQHANVVERWKQAIGEYPG